MIVVWFSCGAASAVAAKKTLELHPGEEVRIVNSPVIEEHDDNRRFLRDVETWLNQPIELAFNPRFPNASAMEVWSKRKYMSGIAGAPCTQELKKEARYNWERENGFDLNKDQTVLGFTADEIHRHERFVNSERPLLPILIDLGITKAECFKIIQDAGIDLPAIYKMGYPNANCIGCVKATSVTYWNHVRKMHPDIFNIRAKQSREIGCKLTRYKGKRIFLDELPEGARGNGMKGLDFDCGIFCKPEEV